MQRFTFSERNLLMKKLKNEDLFGNYYSKINELILKTKHNIVKNINTEMVELYFEIDRKSVV